MALSTHLYTYVPYMMTILMIDTSIAGYATLLHYILGDPSYIAVTRKSHSNDLSSSIMRVAPPLVSQSFICRSMTPTLMMPQSLTYGHI